MPFFLEFTQVFFDWSVRTPLYVSTALFSREASSLKKSLFNFVFHSLGGNTSGLRQNFCSTVVRTALVPRFFNRTYAKNFGFYIKFYWLVCQNSTVRVHRIVFMGNIFFEKKHFSICISHFRRKIFRFSAKVFQLGNQNCIGV